jgi:hypothetical protein
MHGFSSPPRREEDDSFKDLNALLKDINVSTPSSSKGANLPALRNMASHQQKVKTVAALMVMCFMLAIYFMPGLIGQPRSTGLIINDIGFIKLGGEKNKLYQVTGNITNTTSGIVNVPLLRVTLVDDEGNSMQYWEFTDQQKEIGPWNKLPFDTGALNIQFQTGSRLVVEIGSSLELALRRKPDSVRTTPQKETHSATEG